MPDPGVYKFVIELLQELFEFDPTAVPEHWIPLTIIGTLDWICISGWWPWIYTGVFDSNEAYEWVFVYNETYEFDPDQLLVFRERPQDNAFHERIHQPGISDRERSEILQFIYQDVFDRWGAARPPQNLVEYTIWATLMWVLSDFGRGWLGQDPVFGNVFEHGVAYLSRWDNTVVDPCLMRCTQRVVGSCSECGEKLWCVSGFRINQGWKFLCNHCAVLLSEAGNAMDKREKRLRKPHCGSEECAYVRCPHNARHGQSMEDLLAEAGRARVNLWREQVNEVGGQTPRQLSGQSVQDVVNWFRPS
jgi:hypothetical protein